MQNTCVTDTIQSHKSAKMASSMLEVLNEDPDYGMLCTKQFDSSTFFNGVILS